MTGVTRVTGMTAVTGLTGVTGVNRVTGVTGVTGVISVGQWIVTSFQKIYGLYSVEHYKVEKWPYKVGCGWVLWVWWICLGDG